MIILTQLTRTTSGGKDYQQTLVVLKSKTQMGSTLAITFSPKIRRMNSLHSKQANRLAFKLMILVLTVEMKYHK